MIKHPFLFAVLLCSADLWAQAPDIEWSHCYGGTNGESVAVVRSTPDGGALLAGTTASQDGDPGGTMGGMDLWMVRLDANGAILWQHTYGGTQGESLVGLEESADGGYFLLALTASQDGDVTGAHGMGDVWVLKVSSMGDLLWQRALGGSADEFFIGGVNYFFFTDYLAPATDGGCFVACTTNSNDGDVNGGPLGAWDIWIVRLAPDGDLVWQRRLGGDNVDQVYAIRPAADGGVVAVAQGSSDNGDMVGHHGNGDVWVIKLSSMGAVDWMRTYGGSEDDLPLDLRLAPDGGWYIGAITNSNDGDVTLGAGQGNGDLWILKLDEAGDIDWQRVLGGPGTESNVFVRPLADGGCILASTTGSPDGGDVEGSHVDPLAMEAYPDYWVLRLDVSGTVLWQRCLGGGREDHVVDLALSLDGGCVVHGGSESEDGDITGHQGSFDGWLVKLDGQGALQWQRILGSTGYDWPAKVIAMVDGGYVACGGIPVGDGDATGAGHHGGPDIWAVRLENDGTMVPEVHTLGLGLAPQPASDAVHLTMDVPVHDAPISIADMAGRTVLRTWMNGDRALLRTGHLPRGVYMLTLDTPQGRIGRRLVLQ
ncbi:MAG: T9SS type A sorting domain-containing protein [Bacteroidetes bacterium]|nr:T9SS type A sorting domain-containing protein [Bacteroidota bacterium]